VVYHSTSPKHTHTPHPNAVHNHICILSYNNFSRPENEAEEDVYQDGAVVEDNYTGASSSGSGGSVDGTVLESRHD
jgi:hypothetical protein